MKRSGIKRLTPLRGSQTRRGRPRRSAEDFARVYGSKARVTFVKSRPCVWCGLGGESQNAHTVGGGVGRKAEFTVIVPLCVQCHRRYDQHLAPFNTKAAREFVKRCAPKIEAMWQARSGGPEHISSIVSRVMEKL